MVPVYAQILDACEARGITALFGIPDPGFFHLFNAAQARGWTVLAPHHEAAGGFMAEGWARLTGRGALCVGSLGPGIANAAPAMIHAMAERSPVLFLGGRRGGLAGAPARRGRFQHGEQVALYAPAVAYAGAIERADQAGVVLAAALAALRYGPAYVEIPGDVMLALGVPGDCAVPVADMPDVGAAAALVAAARAPVILAGHGVYTARAGELLADLARRIGCPVIQTPGGGAVAPGLEQVSFPYGFSPVAREIIAGSDLVIAVGTEIGEQVHFGQRRHWKAGDAERRWVHIERDGASIGVNRPIDAPLVGDLREILPLLTAACAARGDAASAWWPAEAAHRAAQAVAARAYPDAPLHPARLVVEATLALPEEAILIRDGGASVLFQFTFAQRAARDVLWSQNYGHLGTGLPMAMGAMLAAPGRPALLITGDSAMLFHVAELETAARAGLPLVCVVAVDRQWGLEVGMARRLIGPDTAEVGTHWGAVWFDTLARGLGCDGGYVESGAALGPAIAQAFATAQANRRPYVLHAAIDPRANAEDMPGISEFASWFQA